MVRLHKARGRSPSMFAWKASTKNSLARKARAQKTSLARKEFSISAVRLAVSFVTISPADPVLPNWQLLIMTVSGWSDNNYADDVKKFCIRHLDAPRYTPLRVLLKNLHARNMKSTHKTEQRTKNNS